MEKGKDETGFLFSYLLGWFKNTVWEGAGFVSKLRRTAQQNIQIAQTIAFFRFRHEAFLLCRSPFTFLQPSTRIAHPVVFFVNQDGRVQALQLRLSGRLLSSKLLLRSNLGWNQLEMQ